ncbi:MAG: hypothetical protein RMK89_06535 [Armatimonadota bacterium]|nr:hypothetical protein [Armatimonadota bacterium]MDW8143104.1 hypothetical protein [Armatimonadota bacterium]
MGVLVCFQSFSQHGVPCHRPVLRQTKTLTSTIAASTMIRRESFDLPCLRSTKTIGTSETFRPFQVDSFPIPVCENIRISRSRLLKGEGNRGYVASKRVYFYVLRVRIITDDESFIDEFVIVFEVMT